MSKNNNYNDILNINGTSLNINELKNHEKFVDINTTKKFNDKNELVSVKHEILNGFIFSFLPKEGEEYNKMDGNLSLIRLKSYLQKEMQKQLDSAVKNKFFIREYKLGIAKRKYEEKIAKKHPYKKLIDNIKIMRTEDEE
jgi:hypothetical protein